MRAVPAPRRISGGTDGGGEPHAAVGVHHRVVPARGAVAGRLVPVERGQHAAGRPHRVARREHPLPRAVGGGIDGDEVVAEDAVDGTVRVEARVALVGGDVVVNVLLCRRPLPHGQDEVALDARRAGRRRRHLAGQNAVRPVGVDVQRPLPSHLFDLADHRRPGGAGAEAERPRIGGRVEFVEIDHRHLARRLVAELVTELAAVLQPVDEVLLRPHRRVDAVVAGARKVRGRRHLDQRVPVVGRIDRRRLLRGSRGADAQVDRVAGPGRPPLGVGKAVAPHPDLVGCRGELRDQEAPFVPGDDDLPEAGLEIGGLGNHPDARLGPVGAPHYTRDRRLLRRGGLSSRPPAWRSRPQRRPPHPPRQSPLPRAWSSSSPSMPASCLGVPELPSRRLRAGAAARDVPPTDATLPSREHPACAKRRGLSLVLPGAGAVPYRSTSSFRRPSLLPMRSAGTPSLCSIVR